jgi:5'-methylthioinosine phosphorylase
MLAIIGGSGLYSLGDGFELELQAPRETRYGETSADVLVGRWHGARLAFLPRHGPGHKVPPHRVNYRANIRALQEQGVTRIVSVNAVGGITADLPPGSLAVPDQIIDYSWGREQSFFDGEDGEVRHVDFTRPYSEPLRETILEAGRQAGLSLLASATYGCTNGPRLESAAEIERLRRDGCNLVGMTAMPEAALARELDIAYASIALVVNWAAGIEQGEISMNEIIAQLEKGVERIRGLLIEVVRRGEK